MIKGKPCRLWFIYLDQPVFFLTFCTLYRREILNNDGVHEKFRAYCIGGLDHNVAVGRYVIMPDHIHLFVQGDQKFDLGIWVRGFKRVILPERNCWQPGFFDHVLRSEESYAQKWEYVRETRFGPGWSSVRKNGLFKGKLC